MHIPRRWRWAGAITTAVPAVLLPGAAVAAPAAVQAGAQWPAFPTAISADGQVVAFVQPEAPQFTIGYFVYFVRDLARGVTTPLGFEPQGFRPMPRAVLSADGRYAAAPISTASNPAVPQVVRVDLSAHTTEVVSVDAAGHPGQGAASVPAISADGRYVAFTADAALLRGVTFPPAAYVRDLRTGSTRQVDLDPAGGQPDITDSEVSSVSADGRYVVFASSADNLVAGDLNEAHDVFVRDLTRHHTRVVDRDSAGGQSSPHSLSDSPSMSADGRLVAFRSGATNLVPGDTNASTDIFIRDLRFGITRRVSLDGAGRQADDGSVDPVVSANGRYVAFASRATNLVPGAPDNLNVYVRDLWTHTISRVNLDAG